MPAALEHAIGNFPVGQWIPLDDAARRARAAWVHPSVLPTVIRAGRREGLLRTRGGGAPGAHPVTHVMRVNPAREQRR